MAKTRYTDAIRHKVVEKYKSGTKQKIIAQTLQIPTSTVCDIIAKFRSGKSVEAEHRGGRPRKTTAKTDRRIKNFVLKDPFASSKRIYEDLNLPIAPSTIRERLREWGLYAFRPAKKPLLTVKHRRKRVEFAKIHLNWSISKWKSVLFSDESKFNLFYSDGGRTVRRPRGTRLKPSNVLPTVKHGGASVMVWGCFSGAGVGPLHQITGIMDRFQYKDILESTMLPYAEEEMPLRWVFQQDNDPKHSSKLLKEWFATQNIHVLDWPSQSPDLNPIENLWAILKRRVGKKTNTSTSSLFAALKNEWENIPDSIIDSLIMSMPRRCQEVIKNNGYWTKY